MEVHLVDRASVTGQLVHQAALGNTGQWHVRAKRRSAVQHLKPAEAVRTNRGAFNRYVPAGEHFPDVDHLVSGAARYLAAVW